PRATSGSRRGRGRAAFFQPSASTFAAYRAARATRRGGGFALMTALANASTLHYDAGHMTTFGVGASVKRREDHRLLTGQGRFADDYNAHGQAYAAFVRSPHAHSDVLAIDAAAAKAFAGVLGVFTGRDLAADGVGGIPTLIAERG